MEEDALEAPLSHDIAKVFTKERMRIIETLRDKNPQTIGELSTMLKRDIAAVYRDLKILEKNLIISLQKNGRSVRPVLEKTALTINISKESPEAPEDQSNYVM